MKKISKILSCTLVLLAVFISSFSIGFESKAAGTSANYEFYVNYSEPSTDGYNGYINVMYQGGGGYRLYTYFWNMQFLGDSEYQENNSILMIATISRNNLNLTVANSSSTVAVVTVGYYDWNDDLHILTPSSWVNGQLEVVNDDYSASPIIGYSYSGNVSIGGGSGLRDVPIPEIYWNNSVDAYWLDQELNTILSTLGNIDYDTSYIISQLQNIYNQNVATNQKLDNMTALLQQLTSQSDADKQASQEFNSSSSAQSDKINELNKQNTTEKVDPGGASESVDSHIDTEAIANYGVVLSVFTGNTHILQYVLIVLAVALISYVLFGKR